MDTLQDTHRQPPINGQHYGYGRRQPKSMANTMVMAAGNPQSMANAMVMAAGNPRSMANAMVMAAGNPQPMAYLVMAYLGMGADNPKRP